MGVTETFSWAELQQRLGTDKEKINKKSSPWGRLPGRQASISEGQGEMRGNHSLGREKGDQGSSVGPRLQSLGELGGLEHSQGSGTSCTHLRLLHRLLQRQHGVRTVLAGAVAHHANGAAVVLAVELKLLSVL